MSSDTSAPLISIIIPTIGRLSYLRSALDSVQRQSEDGMFSVEAVLVHDGYLNQEGVDSISGDFSFVRLIRQQQQGVAMARNVGLNAATGAYVAFLDDDDILPVASLAGRLDALLSNPEAVACFGQHSYIDRCGAALGEFDPGQFQHPELSAGFHLCTLLIKRQFALAAGGFNPFLRMAEDVEYCLRLGQVGPLIYLPVSVYSYRQHEASVTATPALPRDHNYRPEAFGFSVNLFYIRLGVLTHNTQFVDALHNKIDREFRYFMHKALWNGASSFRRGDVREGARSLREGAALLQLQLAITAAARRVSRQPEP